MTVILTSDWHVRADVPVARTGDFIGDMFEKIEFIADLSRKNNYPIYIAGDIGHRHQWPNWLLQKFIKIMRGLDTYVIPGQHDLPQHRFERFQQSGFGVLVEDRTLFLMRKIKNYGDSGFYVCPFMYGEEITHVQRRDRPMIAIAHQMVIEDKPLWPGQKAPKGHKLLRKFNEFDLILTGDNHNNFVVESDGRFLVNPGSLMRATAAQTKHKPRIYLWDVETKTLEEVFLPIKEGVVQRTHIETKEQRDERWDAFIGTIRDDVEIELSFEKNMDVYLEANEIPNDIKYKIREAMS